MKAPDLFTTPSQETTFFDGKTYEPTRDKVRLSSAMDRVHDFMSDGNWRTLKDISLCADTSEAGASARLRDFRKVRFHAKYGAITVERRNDGGGCWSYRFVKP